MNGKSQADRDFAVTHVNTVSSGASFPPRCVRSKDFSYHFHSWPNGKPIFRVEAMSGLSYKAMQKAAESDERSRSRVDQLTTGEIEQFFDLRKDPDERVNLMRDPEYQKEIAMFKKRLIEHIERTNDPELPNYDRLVSK